MLDTEDRCASCDPSRFQMYKKRHEDAIGEWLMCAPRRAGFRVSSHNSVANGTVCGLERVDFEFEIPTHNSTRLAVLLLEVDEKQHRTRNYLECDLPRMFNVSSGYLDHNVFWLRYNPDGFKNSAGRRMGHVTDASRRAYLLKWMKLARAFLESAEGVGQWWMARVCYDGEDMRVEDIGAQKNLVALHDLYKERHVNLC